SVRDNGLELIGERIPRLQRYDAFAGAIRLIEARIIVKWRDAIEPERDIGARSDEFGSVDHSRLETHENFCRRSGLGRDAKSAIDLATEPQRAELEAAQVGEALYLAPEPAAHADPGITGHKGLYAKRGIKLIPQCLPAASIDPGDVLAGRQSKRHRRKEGSGRHLALPIKGSRVANICDAVADGIKHFEGRHHFARCVDRNVELASRKSANALSNTLCGHARPWQTLRPGRNHAPFLHLRPRNRRR